MHKLKSNNVYVFGWELPNFGQGQDWRNVFMANTFRPRCLVVLHSTTIPCTKSELQSLIKHAVCWEPFICFANRVEVGWCYPDSYLMRDSLVNFFCARTGVRDWFWETPQLDKTKVAVDFSQPSDSDTVVKQRRRDCTQCCCNGLRNVYELPETLAHLQPSGQIQAGLEGIFESHKYGRPYESSHVFRHMGSPKSSRIFQWNHPAGLPPWNRDISARQAKAGPQCLAFNEAALIGYDMNDQDTAGHRKASRETVILMMPRIMSSTMFFFPKNLIYIRNWMIIIIYIYIIYTCTYIHIYIYI